MKYFLAACSFFLILALAVCCVDAAQFRDSYIRLHILADSDTEEAQEIKLSLRDAFLEEFSERIRSSGNTEDAEKRIEELLPEIESFCNDYLAEAEVSYQARATLSREYYPMREYQDFALPAGTYRSLRILLGSGEGQNWWCVVYPPICLSLASGEDAAVPAGLSREDFETIRGDRTGKYIFRFKILEFFGKIFR